MNGKGDAAAVKGSLRTRSGRWIWVSALISFLVSGAICAFIAYDNRLNSPNDTPEEFAQHTKEYQAIMLESFIGGGILGAFMGVGIVFCLGKVNATPPESLDN